MEPSKPQNEHLSARPKKCKVNIDARGQGHLLSHLGRLDPSRQRRLLDQIEAIPWDVLEPLIPTHVQSRPPRQDLKCVTPAPVHPRNPGPENASKYALAREEGRKQLRAGKVAALTVAGGQGTRLGIDGPKGAVVVTPAGNKTLFELFALTVLAARRKYETAIPWYIMTSQANHEETISFFDAHGFFGLPRGDVCFFSQGMLPAFSLDGKILLSGLDQIALAPDGHGGCLSAMRKSGALADMHQRGIEILSYFQVDNPLVKPFDPLFLGLHAGTGSEMSTKVAPKADDYERVGNVCLVDCKLSVIEYTELPDSLARARNEDGTRRFNAGNLAIHAMDVALVERLTAGRLQLPFRRAEKKVPFVDETGKLCEPQAPNAVKLETFIFDVLPLARNPLVLEVDRAEEFSPVKNATGPDSLETSRCDQVARACRWLEAAGISVPRKADQSPDLVLALSPFFALDAEDMAAKVGQVPPLKPGEALWLE